MPLKQCKSFKNRIRRPMLLCWPLSVEHATHLGGPLPRAISRNIKRDLKCSDVVQISHAKSHPPYIRMAPAIHVPPTTTSPLSETATVVRNARPKEPLDRCYPQTAGGYMRGWGLRCCIRSLAGSKRKAPAPFAIQWSLSTPNNPPFSFRRWVQARPAESGETVLAKDIKYFGAAVGRAVGCPRPSE